MTVVNIRDIRRTLPASRQAISKVEAAIKQAKGQALVLIHPCFSRHEIYSPSTSFDQEEEEMQLVRQVIATQVQELAYKHYLQRVNNRIARMPLPLFLFIENARLIRPSGLEETVSELLPLPEATVIIPTWCRCPAPLWEEPEAEYGSLTQQKADWKILVGLLREIGITKLSLFGELGYMFNREHIGCVYDAEEQLGEHFKVEVNKPLVFPEIDLTRAMINFLNRNRCWG
ncbi:MAG: hypothetical protein WC890_07410 [Candidatus Margulisiibacteriota bacterium]